MSTEGFFSDTIQTEENSGTVARYETKKSKSYSYQKILFFLVGRILIAFFGWDISYYSYILLKYLIIVPSLLL